MFLDPVHELQVQLNRFARWMKLPPLREDSKLGDKTWNFLCQVVGGFIPEAAVWLFSLTREALIADESSLNTIVETVTARANLMQVDGHTWTPAEKEDLSNKILALNFLAAAAGGLLIPTRVVAGGAAMPAWAWGLGVLGVAGLGTGLVLRRRGR